MRVACYDLIKFLAIFMVVWGHVQVFFLPAGESSYMLNFISGVNMPIFFALSGMFAYGAMVDGNVKKIVSSIGKYAYPAVCICALFSVVRLFQDSLGGCICYCVNLAGSYWFIWSLILCMVLTLVLSLVARKVGKASAIVIGVFVYGAMMLFSNSTVAQRTVQMWPFFLIGMFLGGGRGNIIGLRIGIACFVVYLLVVFLGGNFQTNGLGFYWNVLTWEAVIAKPIVLLLSVARFALGCLGIIGLISICSNLEGICPSIARISSLGTTTLGIYLIHWPLLPYAKRLSRWVMNTYPADAMLYTALFSVSLFVICHSVTVMTRRYQPTRRYLWLLKH